MRNDATAEAKRMSWIVAKKRNGNLGGNILCGCIQPNWGQAAKVNLLICTHTWLEIGIIEIRMSAKLV